MKSLLTLALATISLHVNAGALLAQQHPTASWPTASWFHVGRNAAGFADLVDPAGRAFFVRGVGGVRYTGDWTRPGPSPYAQATTARYGSWGSWSGSVLARLSEGGFNCIGGNSDPQWNNDGFPYTLNLRMATNFTPFPNVYDPAWLRAINAVAANTCAQLSQDKSLVGYYTDNELDWTGVTAGQAIEYFRQTTLAIRRYDHNHLILGCRFAGKAPDVALQAMGRFVDVVSLNKYTTATPTALIDYFAKVTGRPVLITEFSAAATDPPSVASSAPAR